MSGGVSAMKFVCYQDGNTPSKWHWKMVANNGIVIAVSAAGHINKIECLRSIYLVRSYSYSADMEDGDVSAAHAHSAS